ncbi:MAG: DegV family protein [Oscillospiraceae bacterium]|nr:DegV family protein [Oscillospiraceae bacterium]
MSFAVFTDGCSNLPGAVLNRYQIRTLPFTYIINGRQIVYNGDIESFDAHAHYELLRAGELIQTSLANSQQFLNHFRPVLEAGSDVIYIGMSSGISGTYQASAMTAAELMAEFPGRRVRTVDSLGAGFGPGLLTILAAQLRDAGKTADETADLLDRKKMDLCEFFTVDDLMFLRRTGRLSTTGALVGTMLGIKPILRGDEEGHIVVCQKCRGRKKAVEILAQLYERRVVDASNQTVAISHGDCPEDAQALADKIRAIAEPKELIFCPHEPVTGSHVGPGMLAVFFFGEGR